jgi:HEPN domain-containing protein
MAERSRDWMTQARADLRHARNAREDGDYTAREADTAIANAEAILEHCRRQVP